MELLLSREVLSVPIKVPREALVPHFRDLVGVKTENLQFEKVGSYLFIPLKIMANILQVVALFKHWVHNLGFLSLPSKAVFRSSS